MHAMPRPAPRVAPATTATVPSSDRMVHLPKAPRKSRLSAHSALILSDFMMASQACRVLRNGSSFDPPVARAASVHSSRALPLEDDEDAAVAGHRREVGGAPA